MWELFPRQRCRGLFRSTSDQGLIGAEAKGLGLKLGLIDYGMGNLHSVEIAFLRLSQPCLRVQSSKDLHDCDALILPGVGSFDPAMENLNSTGLIPDLLRWAIDNKPLLGICLGLQLLFESSNEGRLDGLGLIQGHVERLPDDQNERIPHMGWAPLELKHPSPLLKEQHAAPWMYFVHSYAAVPAHPQTLAATTRFGNQDITAMVWHNRIGACQFHPEKSSDDGSALLEHWLQWLNRGAPFEP